MAYIGRGTESISNVEVLDNLTFDGSASYTLQKSSVNFVPSSANNLLISISGVVQQGNFSVSGSTITFDTTVSASDTCDWILHYGTGLITTVADGAITEAKLGSNAVTTAKINNGAVSYAKTDGNFGKIGQVVSTTKTDTFSTTANGANPVAITGLSASITPSSTSSKILINISTAIGTSGDNHILCTLRRGSTSIGIGDSAGNRPRATFTGTMEVASTGWMMQQPAYNFLDTPSSISSLTYSVLIGGNGVQTIYVNKSHRDNNGTTEDGRYSSTITLMEVLA